jgi:hypothetical protein
MSAITGNNSNPSTKEEILRAEKQEIDSHVKVIIDDLEEITELDEKFISQDQEIEERIDKRHAGVDPNFLENLLGHEKVAHQDAVKTLNSLKEWYQKDNPGNRDYIIHLMQVDENILSLLGVQIQVDAEIHELDEELYQEGNYEVSEEEEKAMRQTVEDSEEVLEALIDLTNKLISIERRSGTQDSARIMEQLKQRKEEFEDFKQNFDKKAEKLLP